MPTRIPEPGTLGIDPGVQGGLSLLSRRGHILSMWLMPTREDAKGHEVIDVVALGRILWSIRARVLHAFVEDGVPKPGKGSGISFMKQGLAVGIVHGSLGTVEIPFTRVRPVDWRRELDQGLPEDMDNKEKSRVVASKLWPEETFLATDRSTVGHIGLIEACLIGEHGRRRVNRGAVAVTPWEKR